MTEQANRLRAVFLLVLRLHQANWLDVITATWSQQDGRKPQKCDSKRNNLMM